MDVSKILDPLNDDIGLQTDSHGEETSQGVGFDRILRDPGHQPARELKPTEDDPTGLCTSCHSEGQCAADVSTVSRHGHKPAASGGTQPATISGDGAGRGRHGAARG